MLDHLEIKGCGPHAFTRDCGPGIASKIVGRDAGQVGLQAEGRANRTEPQKSLIRWRRDFADRG
jgi:hypothetical protein